MHEMPAFKFLCSDQFTLSTRHSTTASLETNLHVLIHRFLGSSLISAWINLHEKTVLIIQLYGPTEVIL